MKMGHDALDNVENNSGSAKHENGTRHPQFRRKRVWERKTWKQDEFGSAENEYGTAQNVFGSAKLENGTRRRGYRPK
jgi:hypothetical protein